MLKLYIAFSEDWKFHCRKILSKIIWIKRKLQKMGYTLFYYFYHCCYYFVNSWYLWKVTKTQRNREGKKGIEEEIEKEKKQAYKLIEKWNE